MINYDLPWQLIADHNEWPKPYTITRRFLFELVGMISLDRNDWKFITCFARIVVLKYILKTEKNVTILEQKILNVRGPSFQRKTLKALFTLYSKLLLNLHLASSTDKVQ